MSTVEYGSTINLADLRDELTSRLTLWLIGVSWLELLYAAFSREQLVTIGLLASLLLLGAGIKILAGARPVLARHLLRVVSDQQVELKRTVRSLEQVNALLRRTQHELVSARKRAEEARRVTEQFAANISHELRTPLNLILGFSEVRMGF